MTNLCSSRTEEWLQTMATSTGWNFFLSVEGVHVVIIPSSEIQGRQQPRSLKSGKSSVCGHPASNRFRRRGGKRRPSLPPSQGRASTPGRSLVAAGAGRLQAAALLSPAAAGRAHCSRRAEPRGGGSPSRVPRGARPGSRRSVPPPLGLTADSHRPDCIINVNGAASVSCEGSSGLVLCDTYPGILTREKAASQQGWKISLSGTHSKCHGKRSDFKTVSSRFYMNKIPNTSLCKTRDLRKSVQTHFDNPQPGRRRPGPRKTSPWVSELIREPTGNRGRRHT
ncbi:uncharacterized protein [Manis javanica]|uniref:uncharacterized protein n=1 Tax=Manis javanica TaxID=9974 RepID=UPI003C6D6271